MSDARCLRLSAREIERSHAKCVRRKASGVGVVAGRCARKAGDFRTVTDHENLSRAALQERLLLCLNGIGTNTGLKRMAAGQDDVTYRDLLYVRRRFITRESMREAIAQVVNGTCACPPSRNLGRRHDRMRRRFQAVWRLGSEPDDRVARPLRRPRRHDLLACRAPQHLHLFTAQDAILFRSRGHDRSACTCSTTAWSSSTL